MRRLLLVALVLTSIGACKRKKNLDGRMDELEVIRNDMCACRDAACRAYQRKVVGAWQMRNDSTDSAKAKPAQKKRYQRLYHEFEACDEAALDTGSGSAE